VEDFTEKRRHPRINVRWPITISKDNDIIGGETRNIAFDGISICCEEPLPMDEIVNILIEPEGHQEIIVAGKVIWSDIYGIDDKDTTYGVGICFVKLSEENRARYLELIAEHLEE